MTLLLTLALLAAPPARDRPDVEAEVGIPWTRILRVENSPPGGCPVLVSFGDDLCDYIYTKGPGYYPIAHTYSSPGDYRVIVTAWHGSELEGRGSFVVRVRSAAPRVAMEVK